MTINHITPLHENPIDLLPIPRPLENVDIQPTKDYFYNNVIQCLIKDVLRMQANGIPINLDRVKEVETAVNTSLDSVYQRLENNSIIRKFLEYKDKEKHKAKAKEISSKVKTYLDYLTKFKPNNKTHRSVVVNAYLESIGRNDLVLESWSIKDLKTMNSILKSPFISEIITGHISMQYNKYIEDGMISLAETKARLYNTNLKKTIEDTKSISLINSFNPGSSLQKQELFSFYGIEAEKQTKAGAPQWDRKALEDLQHLLDDMIKE